MAFDRRPSLIALMGPTASGKTALAVEWARRLGAQIISVDSALVYRGLVVGSAKPDAAVLRQAPHRLIDIREPYEPYSAADFALDARRELEEIARKNLVPLLVGGTGLYFHALLYGLSAMPEADPAMRLQLEQEAARRGGWSTLHAELARHDPAAANRIHATDAQRIQRALEVFRLTGKPISEWQRSARRQSFPWRVLKLVIAPSDRALLHARIAQRFDAMLDHGLLDEVRGLVADSRLHENLPSMRAVGYRQAWQHLRGEFDLATLRQRGIEATRQLAKRQLTWLRSELDARWFDPERDRREIDCAVEQFVGVRQ